MLRFRDLGCFVFDLGCFVFEFWVLRASVFVFVFDLGCFVFEFWVLRFRDLGCFVFDLGCFVFEFWVLRASVFVFECFVFETTVDLQWFWNPNQTWLLPTRCANCKAVISAETIASCEKDQSGVSYVEYSECLETVPWK